MEVDVGRGKTAGPIEAIRGSENNPVIADDGPKAMGISDRAKVITIVKDSRRSVTPSETVGREPDAAVICDHAELVIGECDAAGVLRRSRKVPQSPVMSIRGGHSREIPVGGDNEKAISISNIVEVEVVRGGSVFARPTNAIARGDYCAKGANGDKHRAAISNRFQGSIGR